MQPASLRVQEEVAKLARQARSKKMSDYREGSVAAQAHLGGMARQLALTAFIRDVELIPAGSRAFAVSKIHDVTEELGGSDAAYSELSIVEEWDDEA